MKVTHLALMGLLTLALTGFPTHAAAQNVRFSGQVIDSSTHLTQVTPTRQYDGTTAYVVTSTVTGQQLAVFPTKEAAEYFASQLHPATAYR